MKHDALLINTARGGLIDDHALIDALKSGKLGGAGIDVLRDEPPREGNPLLEAELPNLIVTPHNAWASTQAMQTLADQLVDNLEAFVEASRGTSSFDPMVRSRTYQACQDVWRPRLLLRDARWCKDEGCPVPGVSVDRSCAGACVPAFPK